MSIKEILPDVRYVTDVNGAKTDVLVPFAAWQALLSAWNVLIEKLEDQEDQVILLEWLEERSRGEAKTISLDELEAELIADGLLPSPHS
jgi:hypothetical protein